MASLNRCDFIGRTGKDPEVRYTSGGTAVASVSIACSEKFKDKAGALQEKTEWINLTFWGKLAEIVGEYVTKGQEIYVSGRMQTRKWQDKDGNDRYTTEIVCDKMQMLGGKREGGGGNRQETAGQSQEPPANDWDGFNPDDDIPFS